jgi:hypothetical protein
MEKALKTNTEAMFKVPLGDSIRHAVVVGERRGLEIAFGLIRKEYRSDEDGEDFR